MFPYSRVISEFKQTDNIYFMFVSKSPLVFIIIISETARQNKTNFLSYVSLLEMEKSPSVSKIRIPSQLLKFYNLMYVPYIPLVHLPVLVMKSHPNKKLSRVDFPEL